MQAQPQHPYYPFNNNSTLLQLNQSDGVGFCLGCAGKDASETLVFGVRRLISGWIFGWTESLVTGWLQ